jgi:methionyl-tRNA formyltransferase
VAAAEATSALKVIFAGTPEFAVAALEALLGSKHEVVAVYTQPDRPAGRGRKLAASPVKQCARAAGIDVYQPESLRDTDIQQQLRSHQADVMVVVAYGLLLPEAVLLIPRLGCLNIHASLLPRWRGAAPIQQAILAGDTVTGVTIMQMDTGLDTGDCLTQKRCAIGTDDTAATLHDRLAALGAAALLETLDELVAGTAEAMPQDDAAATYAGKLSKAQAELDWQKPAVVLDRQVRAFNPWPVAQTHWQGVTLRVWRATPGDAAVTAAPGTVLGADAAGICVAAAAGVLVIEELQLPGKRRMTAGEFINAHDLGGAVFTSPGT